MESNILKDWNKFELFWLCTFSLIAIILTVLWHDTFFGLSVFFTGVLCVVLTAKGNIWSYFFGFFNTLGYAYLAFTNQLFGEMGLNLFFFLPMTFVGYFIWKKHLVKGNQVEMKKMNINCLSGTIALCIIGIVGMGYGLSLIATQNTPYIDATTNVLSIAAAILTAKRMKEQWLFYIILNIFTVIMWSIRTISGSSEGSLMIIMWSAYLVNSVYGYYNWSKGANMATEAAV